MPETIWYKRLDTKMTPKSFNSVLTGRFKAGSHCDLFNRINLNELTKHNNKLRTLEHVVCETFKRELGMDCIQITLNRGLQVLTHVLDSKEADKILKLLRDLGIQNTISNGNQISRYENIQVIFSKFVEAAEQGKEIPPLLVIVRDFQYIIPILERSGANEAVVSMLQTVEHLIASYSFRSQKVYFLFQGDDTLVDPQITRAIRVFHALPPNFEERTELIDTFDKTKAHAEFKLATGITKKRFANLTMNMSNRAVEELVFSSARSKEPIAVVDIVEKKIDEVKRQSEGVLTFVDTNHAKKIEIVGRTAKASAEVLYQQIEQLADGNPSTQLFIVLCGPPGIGKTMMVKCGAAKYGLNLFEHGSAKDPLVGATARKAKLVTELIRANPGIYQKDEIDLSLPGANRKRAMGSLDGGASAEEASVLYDLLSDEKYRGRFIYIGCTNVAEAISGAFGDRALFIPVLRPNESDLSEIITFFVRRIDHELTLDPTDSKFKEAVHVFFEKEISPRSIINKLHLSKVHYDATRLTEDLILRTALDANETSEQFKASALYAELTALLAADTRATFPWKDDPNFPFHPKISSFVNNDGSLRTSEIQAKIKELSVVANV